MIPKKPTVCLQPTPFQCARIVAHPRSWGGTDHEQHQVKAVGAIRFVGIEAVAVAAVRGMLADATVALMFVGSRDSPPIFLHERFVLRITNTKHGSTSLRLSLLPPQQDKRKVDPRSEGRRPELR
jgi:hypothetical protein